jgi:hypothetical protein
MTSLIRLLVLATFIAASAGWAHAQTSGAPSRTSPQAPESRFSPPPSDDMLMFVGEARASTEAEAIKTAAANATFLAIAAIAEVLFANPEYAGLYGAKAIEDYVRSVGRVTERRAAQDPASREFRGYARFELKKAYAQISAIREYATQAQQPGYPEGFFLVPVAKLTADKVTLPVEVRAGKPSNGSFSLQFSLRRLLSGVFWIRVESIRVIQDASRGATGWGFDIWANGQRVLTLRERRYDERIGNYPMAPEDKSVEATVRSEGAGYIEFRVVGTKPSAAGK